MCEEVGFETKNKLFSQNKFGLLPIGFFSIQLDFARKASLLLGIPYSLSLIRYTSLYTRLHFGYCVNEKNVDWKKFVANLPKNYQKQVVKIYELYLNGFKPENTSLPCFSYSFSSLDKSINIHFTNRDPFPRGPLSSSRLPIRLMELKKNFNEIKEKYPQAEMVKSKSWLLNIPKYLSLFPREYKTNISTVPNEYNFQTIWGQFLNHKGELNSQRTLMFLDKVEKAKNIQQLEKSFPLKILATFCTLDHAFDFYGIES